MTSPVLGVVVVTFNASDVILDCLESLLAAEGVHLDIVVVDNASTDTTVADLRTWADGSASYRAPDDMPFPLSPAAKPLSLSGDTASPSGHWVTLSERGVNGGFADGVNHGLGLLARNSDIDRFWVLNPDSAVPPQTPRALASHDPGTGDFALMGSRVVYYDTPDIIQIDGGILDRRTGVTGNVGLGQPGSKTPPPNPATFDFIMGASMVASRAFYERAGPMPENYFLYYEEVDWAMRRDDLPLVYCPGALVYHRAGTAIGSPTLGRPASPFSLYFKHRGRLRFVRRFLPWSLPGALAYSVAKAGQLALRGYFAEAWTVLAGSLGLPPPRGVRARLSDAAAERAFRRSS